MPRSFAQSTDLTCPRCGHTFSAEVWLIVDAGERPDLLARARPGELHDVPCPHCGGTGTVDAPLLIYLPDPAQDQPPLIFSPAQQSSREQTQQQGSALLGILAGALGPAWQDAWLERIATVPRPLLPAALSDDPATAMRQMQAEMAMLQKEWKHPVPLCTWLGYFHSQIHPTSRDYRQASGCSAC